MYSCMHEQAYKDYPCLFGTQYIMGGKLCSKTRCCIKKIKKRLDKIIVCIILTSAGSEAVLIVLAKPDVKLGLLYLDIKNTSKKLKELMS